MIIHPPAMQLTSTFVGLSSTLQDGSLPIWQTILDSSLKHHAEDTFKMRPEFHVKGRDAWSYRTSDNVKLPKQGKCDIRRCHSMKGALLYITVPQNCEVQQLKLSKCVMWYFFVFLVSLLYWILVSVFDGFFELKTLSTYIITINEISTTLAPL